MESELDCPLGPDTWHRSTGEVARVVGANERVDSRLEVGACRELASRLSSLEHGPNHAPARLDDVLAELREELGVVVLLGEDGAEHGHAEGWWGYANSILPANRAIQRLAPTSFS